jgi:hypothetical protein
MVKTTGEIIFAGPAAAILRARGVVVAAAAVPHFPVNLFVFISNDVDAISCGAHEFGREHAFC